MTVMHNDQMLVSQLQAHAPLLSTPDLFSFLVEELGGECSQFEVMRLLKAAFPTIPLRLLIEASTSNRVIGTTGMCDADLVELLGNKLS